MKKERTEDKGEERVYKRCRKGEEQKSLIIIENEGGERNWGKEENDTRKDSIEMKEEIEEEGKKRMKGKE